MSSAQHWQPIDRDGVRCTLCYRGCELAPGEAGVCKIRRNEAGRLVLTAHGELGCITPRKHDSVNFYPHASVVLVGGVSCTSHCSFCHSCNLALNPDRLPVSQPHEMDPTNPRQWWFGGRAYLSAADVIHKAQAWHCQGVYFSMNEPTLTIEYTREVAQRATHAGLFTSLDTNGFTSPSAIAWLAPWIDHVHIGGKGHLDPDFYARRMLAPGAVPHVLAAIEAWRDTGTHLLISDLLTPPAWLPDDAEAERQMTVFYSWIAEHVGDVGLHLRPLYRPDMKNVTRVLPRNATPADSDQYDQRVVLAERAARSCGLTTIDVFDMNWFNRPSLHINDAA